MAKHKVGIISANWGAMAHLPAWRALPDVEVVGICTRREETAKAAAEKFHIPRPFWNVEEMAADPEISIIDCGTSPRVRHDHVLAALKNGKHVYNGIPFAAGFEESRELYEAWKASGKVGMVDAYSQWLGAPQCMKEMMEAGALGRPFGGQAFFNMALFNVLHPMFPWGWFSEGGHGVSAVRNLGSHMLHMLVFLFGEVAEVMAEDSQLLDTWMLTDGTTKPVETNDFANLTLKFTSGFVLQVQICWVASVSRGFSIEAFGSNGRFLMEAPSFPTTKDTTLKYQKMMGQGMEPVELPARLVQPENINIAPDYPVDAAHGMAISLKHMLNVIENDASGPAPDFEQAWQVERIQEAIQRSSKARQWVRLDEIS